MKVYVVYVVLSIIVFHYSVFRQTEFLVQLDGARTTDDERVLIVGATNRPQELDEAARRRLVKRLYIPLPEIEARIQILTSLLKKVPHQLDEEEIREIGRLTNGYEGR